jgi:polar amino acid transport system permease protein
MPYQLDFAQVSAYTPELIRGAWFTIRLTAASTALGLLIGIAGACCRSARSPVLRCIAASYVELIRNTPFLVQLFFVFFGLPSIGIKLTSGQAALLAMVVNLGAYATEIVRAGIQAIRLEQIEAGLSLGLTHWQVFRYVVLLPALRHIYPALTSQFIILMLGSAVVSQISAEDLTFAANFIQSRSFRSFETYFIVTAAYLALAIGFRFLFNRLGVFIFRWSP